MQIVSIGNAPSSGSTFLADLLDSLPHAACGPELHLFSPASHYVAAFDIFRRAPCPACHAAYADRFGKWALDDYGLSKGELRTMLARSADFPSFVRAFADNYAVFRQKPLRIFFEKTPENIHSARHFLSAFPDGFFVHIVRHPLHVYRSLRRRNYGPYLAAASWLVDVAAAYALRDHPRALTVRYERLTQDPEATVRAVLTRLGHDMPVDGLLDKYRDNRYRDQTHRAPSWTYSDYGVAGNANRSESEPEDDLATALIHRLTIAPAYARKFDLPVVSVIDLATYFGYELPSATPDPRRNPRRDVRSLSRLALKAAKYTIFGMATPGEMPVYLRPAEMSI